MLFTFIYNFFFFIIFYRITSFIFNSITIYKFFLIYFRVFASYGVVTISLIMYETKKRKNKSLVGQQLARAQKEEEAQNNG